jgi:hypothetical protein
MKHEFLMGLKVTEGDVGQSPYGYRTPRGAWLWLWIWWMDIFDPTLPKVRLGLCHLWQHGCGNKGTQFGDQQEPCHVKVVIPQTVNNPSDVMGSVQGPDSIGSGDGMASWNPEVMTQPGLGTRPEKAGPSGGLLYICEAKLLPLQEGRAYQRHQEKGLLFHLPPAEAAPPPIQSRGFGGGSP